MKPIIITLDGYSSCGKSTLARQLANKLNYVFIDSGAMYRAITLYFLRHHVKWSSEAAIHKALGQITLYFQYNPMTGQSDMFLNDENIEAMIRDMLVSENVSEVAALKEVREFAVAQQQKMGDKKGIVMDGRDIGTTVFPQRNPNITIEEVKRNLEMRDYIDSNREFSPLRQAADAVVLDNTNLTREEQLSIALGWAKNKIES